MNWIQQHQVVLLNPCAWVNASYKHLLPNWQVKASEAAVGKHQADASIHDEDSDKHGAGDQQAAASLPQLSASAQSACSVEKKENDDSHAEDQVQERVQDCDALLAKRKRSRKRKKEQLSQQELDARHPGNARNRVAQEVVSHAWQVFAEWLSTQHQGQLQPAVAAALQQWQQVPADSSSGAVQPPAAAHESTAAGVTPHQHTCVVAGIPAHSHSTGQYNDWAALHSMRSVVHPKISLTTVAGTTLHESAMQSECNGERSCAHQQPDAIRTAPATGATEAGGNHADAGLDMHNGLGHTAEAVITHLLLPGLQHNLYSRLISNSWHSEVVARAHDTSVVIPASSAFLMTDLSNRHALQPLVSACRRFKVIVADPPWENASVKRSGRYQTMPSRQLLQLPIQQLLDQETGVLLLWMTNREKLHRFVHEELLPAWGLTHAATWFWLKVASGGGSPVSSLTSMHRHPFEHLLVCVPNGTSNTVAIAPVSSTAPSASGHPTELPPCTDGSGVTVPAGSTYQPGAHLQGTPMAAPPDSSVQPHAAAVATAAATTVNATPREAAAPTQLLQQLHQPQQVATAQGPTSACTQGNTFACTQGPTSTCAQLSEQPSTHSDRIMRCLPRHLVLLSVPSAEHSRKPHLGPLIRHLLPDLLPQQPSGCTGSAGSDSTCQQLELFAREMHAGWVSAGNEVLHFQQLDMFKAV